MSDKYDVKIIPSPLHGVVEAISSKSDAHRLLIAASLSEGGGGVVSNVLSKDIEATIDCLSSLGSRISTEKIGSAFRITVSPIIPQDTPLLDCKESGSTARFLLPVAAVVSHNATLTGQGKLPDRPFTPLTLQMEKNGCKFSRHSLPITVNGRLCPGEFALDGDISSQFISGLLFALPLLDKNSIIKLNSPLQSVGYVDMTINTLSRFGVEIEAINEGFFVKGNQHFLHEGSIFAEGDWSNSAFWLCGGALSESTSNGNIFVSNILQNSLQRDKQITDLLTLFGADIKKQENGFSCGYKALNSIEIDAGEIPDLVPVLAAVAALSNGKTTIYNARRLRFKESDRLHTTCAALSSIGADIVQGADGDCLIINGKKRLCGGITDSFNDHRIAMAVAIAACRCDNEVIITNAQAVEKSYPAFFEDYNSLGGKAYVIEHRQ